MTETEHLLECFAEECLEVAQRVTKANRFGLGEVQPGQELTNEQRIVGELNDLMGVLEMLRERHIITTPLSRDAMDAKKLKVAKFMGYARELGTLEGSGEDADELVHIWSGEWKAYWGPGAGGYTPEAMEAGVWPRAEAERLTSHCDPEKKIELRSAHRARWWERGREGATA